MSVFHSQLPALLTSSPASDSVYIISSYNWETFKKQKSWDLVPSLHGKQMGEKWKQWQILFSRAPKSLWMVTAAMKLKDTCTLEEKLTNLDNILKSRDISFPTKACIVKATVFSVIIYKCESWTIKKARAEKLMLLNCSARGSLGQQRGQHILVLFSYIPREVKVKHNWKQHFLPIVPSPGFHCYLSEAGAKKGEKKQQRKYGCPFHTFLQTLFSSRFFIK